MTSPNWIDAVIDGGPDFFDGGTVTRVDVCTSEPANYAAIVSLVGYTLTGGDFTKAAGDVSGRKVTMGAQTAATAGSAGTGNFLAFSNGSNLMYGVIDGDGDVIASGQQVDIAATDVYEVQAAINE